MPTDLATLAISVKTDGVTTAKGQLDDLGKSSQQAEQSVKSLGTSSEGMGSSMAGASTYASNLAAQFAAMVGVTLSVAAGFEAIKTALKDINEFNLGVISGAAMMLSRAGIQGIEEQKAAYADYSTYMTQMYEALEEETVNHFASGREMRQTLNALDMQGIYAHQQDAKAVGVITDAIKLMHGGTMEQMTALTEINGILQGHEGRYARLGTLLHGTLGEGWKEIVQTSLQNETFLELMQQSFQGLVVAQKPIQEQMSAWENSLSTIISQIGRGGLQGMYEDIVGLLKDIDSYLRVHKDELVGAIAEGWRVVSANIKEAYSIIKSIYDIVSVPIVWAIKVNFLGLSAMADIWNRPPAAGSKGGGGGGGWVEPGDKAPSVAPPPWKPTPMKETVGAKDTTQSTIDALQQKINSLLEDINKTNEGLFAGVDAWAVKAIADIEKVADRNADSTMVQKERTIALGLVDDDVAAKKTKIENEFNNYVLKATGDRYAAINEKYNQDLIKYKGIADEEVKLEAMKAKQIADVDYKYALDVENMRKGYMSAMAGAAPLLTDQLALQGQILEIETKRNQLELENKIAHDHINQSDADELRGLLALTTQAQRYAMALKAGSAQTGLQGITAGLEQANINAINTAATSTSKMVVDAFAQMPQTIGGEMATFMVNTLQGKKTDFQQLGWSMAQSMLSALWTGMIQQIMPAITKAIMGVMGVGGTGSATGLPVGSSEFYDFMYSSGGYAKGGVFDQGGHVAFASGGVVSSPTVFPFAGGTGLMGENGPEAIIPLKRTSSGALGISSEGGGGVVFSPNITVNNSAPNANASVQTTPQGDITVWIDDATAKAYSRGGTLRKVISQDKGMIRR